MTFVIQNGVKDHAFSGAYKFVMKSKEVVVCWYVWYAQFTK